MRSIYSGLYHWGTKDESAVINANSTFYPSKQLPNLCSADLNHNLGTGWVTSASIAYNGYISFSHQYRVSNSGDPIPVKKIIEGGAKVTPGKFGLKGQINTDAIEQLINDGKRFFLTAGGQQLLNNILSGVS